ncbi:MAG TPA: hypothetical protein VM430_08270 [Microbacterium sp.]|jgi:hypothetical protein|nr:hypothetical protein [Microbacterium sp.]
MKNALDIFARSGLTVAIGESHTTGARQVRIEVLGNSVRMPVEVAKELASEINYWADRAAPTTPTPVETAHAKVRASLADPGGRGLRASLLGLADALEASFVDTSTVEPKP